MGRIASTRLIRTAALGVALALAAMGERDVAGLARRERERHADQIGLHGVERRRLGVDRDDPGGGRAVGPVAEPID